ncbi:FtsK/SpoIIIE domain-containing protein [Bacillus smithii]|uniref:FtsK/SpoIIIE domain-containing protein n=1 Tax=Bacillus smithii TaxID=1479 RepID=UPI002E1E1427|nr:FtsK/SpoIIIE domain-containing protein [Bacillus smithii]MED1456675.1 FtsK/SpoIIIE domain-containing protein [Bacillus smithii]
MIEWILPAVVIGAALVPTKRKSDKRIIQEVFERTSISIKKGDSIVYPKLVSSREGKYVYSLPIGLSSEFMENIELTMKEALDKEIEWEFRNGFLHIRVFDDKLPSKWDFSKDLKTDTWEVPIGKNHQGVLYHDFDKYPHMLVGGTTRFGKTVFLKVLLASLLLNKKEDVDFYILDLKGGLEFSQYKHLHQVKTVASDLLEACKTLDGIIKDLKKREQFFKEKGISNIAETKIQKRTFIIVDEAAELSPKLVSKEHKKYAEYCMNCLGQIARIGGAMGYRLIYATQYPTREAVPGQVKMNMVARLAFKMPESMGSRVILDETGAEELDAIPGRAIYKVEKKREIQAPYISDKTLEGIINGLNSKETRTNGNAIKND